jgi:hypothetical protein
MSGAFLIGFFIIGTIFFIISFFDYYNDDGWRIAGVIAFILGAILLIAIPISRIDSKTNAEYVKVLQETIDKNRLNTQDLNVLERATIIDEINSYNMKITTWRTKGEKWYNNKWYYDSSTQEAKFIE